MKHLKQLFVLVLLAVFGIGQMWADDVTSTYTLSVSDAGASVDEDIQNVNWSWGTTAVGKGNGTNPMIKVVGTITVTLPSGAELKSVRAELNNANNWGNSVTLKFKAGSTDLASWAKGGSSDAVTISSNKTNGTYTFVGNGNAWVKSLSVTYTPGGSTKPTVFLNHTEIPSNSLIFNTIP